MFEFILERYNYWIVITLMMIGLYIVFSRGNLVKTIIGLNVFQTSVFVFYITIGKVAGATAPVLIKTKGDKAHGEGHGGDHGDGHGEAEASGHDTVDHLVPHEDEADALIVSTPAQEGSNTLDGALEATSVAAASSSEGQTDQGEGLHSLPEGTEGASNDLFSTTGEVEMADKVDGLHQTPEVAVEEAAPEPSTELAHVAPDPYPVEATPSFVLENGEILYTNPLPHVLILTAIVVGIATTAVGLALSVRIREAYGTIEEDELEAADHLSQFGRPLKPATQEGGVN